MSAHYEASAGAPDPVTDPAPAAAPAGTEAAAALAVAAWEPARPQLSPRHSAMLAEMGVRPWWRFGTQTEAAPAPAPQTAPARPARRTEPAAVPTESAVRAATPPPPTAAAAAAAVASRATPSFAPASAPAPASRVPIPNPAPDWDALEQQIRSCQRCPLGAQRQCAVPGMGDRRPDWLLVGEAPGEEEDRQGLPFVGRAGQLLDRMLAALQLQRTQRVHITNVIKCRPPQNRNPAADEIAHCAPYLRRQIELLQPKIVLALGRFAAQTLLAEGGCLSPDELHTLPLGKLRGRIYQARIGAQTLPLVVTYHPAYLLRSPADKARAWADLCLAADALEAAAST